MIFLITILAIFFAVNMGGSSFAASFAPAYGGKVLSKRTCGVLFVVFVVIGSVLLGQHVSVTLGNKIVDPIFVNAKEIIVIFIAAGISMFVANLFKIPQSTSLVTVASIAGVAVYHRALNLGTIYYLLPYWVILPILSFVITYVAAGFIYPPRKGNFWIYEKFVNQQGFLRKFVIFSSCYNAFSVGTNNVANVVGPLMAGASFDMLAALFVFALFYGAGSFVFIEPLKTAGIRIVPLGLLTASIISMVSGSLIIFASVAGVPQSFVMIQMGAIFAISSLKHGKTNTFNNPLTRNTLYNWTINPMLTFFVSYGLAWLIIR